MATANTRKYLVREGFVVVLTVEKPNGDKHERTYTGGDEITLTDDDAELHKHKLEFASQKERNEAAAAEKELQVAKAAQNSPVELVQMLVQALSQAQAAAAPAAEAPAA